LSAPLRVLHAHSGNLYGGVETILVTLARLAALEPRLEHRFALCFEGRLSEELRSAGAQVDSLGPLRLSRPWTARRARSRLRRLLAEQAADRVVVHSGWAQVAFGSVAYATGVELVAWVHGIGTGPWLLERWARRTPPRRLVCVSEAVRDDSARRFPSASAAVVHAPLPDRPAPPGFDRAALRARCGAGPGTLVFFHPGRIDAGKGHDVLLAALARLDIPENWACWLVGGGQRPADSTLESALRSRAKLLGIGERVHFLGHRDDVGLLLRAADLCVHPHTAPEGFGLALVEALYAGRPVVATGLGGSREIVDDSCGLLVPPGDAPALAAALSSLALDPGRRAALSAAGPARARLLCDPATQLPALYEQLVR
jgi:glycosyltransferase involved in cell wall biosynthesis